MWLPLPGPIRVSWRTERVSLRRAGVAGAAGCLPGLHLWSPGWGEVEGVGVYTFRGVHVPLWQPRAPGCSRLAPTLPGSLHRSGPLSRCSLPPGASPMGHRTSLSLRLVGLGGSRGLRMHTATGAQCRCKRRLDRIINSHDNCFLVRCLFSTHIRE